MRKKISVDQCNNRDGDRSNWTYNILIYDLEYEKKKKIRRSITPYRNHLPRIQQQVFVHSSCTKSKVNCTQHTYRYTLIVSTTALCHSKNELQQRNYSNKSSKKEPPLSANTIITNDSKRPFFGDRLVFASKEGSHSLTKREPLLLAANR